MEKESTHARAGDPDVVDAGVGAEPCPSSSSSPAKKADLDKGTRPPGRASLLEEDEDSKPRFWKKYSSSKLNEPVEGEGLDLEAERRAHQAHERHEKVCLGPAAAGSAAAASPGSEVAAAMARLGRESLSMAD